MPAESGTPRPLPVLGYALRFATAPLPLIESLQRDPDVFPEPATFDPDRWAGDRSSLTQRRHSCRSVAAGPRHPYGGPLSFVDQMRALPPASNRAPAARG